MHDSLDRSILRVIVAYLALQLAVFAAFSLASGFFWRYSQAFGATSISFHLFLFLLLKLFKGDFAIADTGVALPRVNLANKITLFRVSSLPTLLFLVIASRDYAIRLPLLAFMALVFASDFLDGWVSRTRGQVTRVGKMMDSASDYLVLVVLTVVFFYFRFIQDWFFWLVVGRLSEQAVFMAIIFLVRGRVKPRTTFLGKAAIASIMVLYSGLLLELLFFPFGIAKAVSTLEILVAAVIVVSVADKVLAFVQDLSDREP
ncbi:MAG TPA: CDP-alcohol phosphatidyltransferase family protein [Rectinemataceae bacterium]|nr:CDP-alcohol phosphatidyltransferase family protein [Rectinemataceae bacterium]